MKHSVPVAILGQQYVVKSEAPPEEVHKVAAFVNDRIAEVTAARKTADSLNAAVLALLNVSGAYLRLRDRGGDDGQAEERIRSLLTRLEQVCPETEAELQK